ncbi:MAG TPA: DUF5979 domain-containing protein, partial [Candidatus Thermoplasmatota archaeon]|nr:DUF5979 domain-containing protein [Candidatus Thermoplasmatota archaeon]
SEAAVTGYAGPTFTGDCNSSGIVTLVNGVTKTCTLTNDDQPATLIVIKHVINDDGGIKTASDFTLSATCVVGSFAGAESPGTTFNSLSAGACTVSEAAVTGYAGPTFTGDCNSSGIVTLVNGATKTCTLTNNDAAGSLTVIKHVINDDGGSKLAGDFTLHVVCGVEIVGSPLDGAESPGTTFNGLSAGACTVSEDAESGYTGPVFSGDCNSSGIVTIVNGAAKTCTLTNNDQPATLIVIKHVVNDNGGTKDAGDFTLSATCVVGSFAGAESPGTSFTGLNAGACTVSEGAESGYTGPVFTGDCNSSGIVTLVNGATKTCTLTNNDQAGSLIVIKHVVNDNGGDASAADFTIHVSCGGSEIDAAAGLESPGRSYPGLDVGTCTVTEDAVSGYAGPTYSGNCDSSGDVTIVAGATRTCTLTNDDEAGSLTVDKVLDPAGAGTFNLRIDGTSHADCVGDGGSTGAVAVDAGIYTVDETACAGTDSAQFVSVISGDCDEFGSVTVGLGESKSCTITNTMKGRLSILKVLSTGADPSGITFQLRVGASTSSAGTLVAGGATDALGVPQFVCGAGAPQGCSIDGILQVAVVPGTYQVCELNVPVGWTTSLSLDPTAFSLDYTHTLDNSNICVVVTVAAGDGFLNTNNLPISVTNTPPPGGDARTIGYWRNHASCKTSNGKQDPVLDDVLANNLSGSVLIGDLNVDTCQEAVALLKKSDVVTGSKRASDAAYGLAAQLMAAVLNVAANAGTCPAANDAIADGQALLDAIGFTGTGSYLGPKSGSPDRATALSIAATLDAYNNNLLCPP